MNDSIFIHPRKLSVIGVLPILLAIFCFGCSGNADGDTVRIYRLDRYVVIMPADSIVKVMPDAVKALSVVGNNQGELPADVVKKYSCSPAVKVFGPDVERILPDLSMEERILSEIRESLSKSLPGLEFPAKIYGYITPYFQRVVFCDSVMLIGLNHYLGTDYEGYGAFDNYEKALKRRERMPFDVAEALVSTAFPFRTKSASTALNRILYEGAVAYIISKSVPGCTPADALGYTPDQMDWCMANESNIWHAMAEKGLIYSIDQLENDKLINPAPNTAIVHPDSPGRIGRFIGYRIADAYMKRHKSEQMEMLLSPGYYDSQYTLIESAYSPN